MPRRGLITGEEIPREDRNTQRGGRKPGLRWSRLSKKTSQRLLKTCAFYFCLQQIAPTFHDDCKPASLWLSVIPDPKSRMSLERFLLEGSWSRRPLRPLLAPHISDFGRPAARTPTSLPAPCPSGALVGHRADATGVSVKSGVAGFENFLATNIHLLLLKTCEGTGHFHWRENHTGSSRQGVYHVRCGFYDVNNPCQETGCTSQTNRACAQRGRTARVGVCPVSRSLPSLDRF